ncbi:MAG TPA: alpha/beta fold hydrolase [Polyangiaceae bacterium]|nr:alpha/beta fold hydrolase [Polyangiaceae bacterium]
MNRSSNTQRLVLLICLILPSCSSDDAEIRRAPSAPLQPDIVVARPAAPAANSACALESSGVVTIERPMFPSRADSPSFGYSFRVHPGTDPDAPTVIYLPGGPGEASIGERNPELLPDAYTLVQTDPRGVGCNAPGALALPGALAAEAPSDVAHYPLDFYDSVAIADDVLGIVREMALDDYVLYGISYGTLLATLVASRAATEGLAPPRAVLLEGVLGRAFTRDGEVEASFQEHWRTVRDGLPEAVRAQLVTAPLPLGLSAEQWGAGLTTLLSLATIAPPDSLAESLLLSLDPEASDEERQSLYDTVLSLNESEIDAFGLRMHEAVACHEITETNFRALALVDGELVRTEAYCTSDPLDRPFEAGDWPITSPLYYFSGSDDPNTPPWQAQAHYDAMLGAPRWLVSVIAAGHNPLAFNLLDCQPALWAAVIAGSGFADAVASCPWPTALASAPAEPR